MVKPKITVSIEKAKKEKLFYFVVTSVIYNPKLKKCLIMQRSKSEIAHPRLWGVAGGKLEHSDMLNNPPTRKNHDIYDWQGLVDQLIIREAKEETGLNVGEIKYLENVVFLRPDNVPVVLMQFAAKYKSGKVKLPPEFDDHAWVGLRDLKKYKMIQGIDGEIKKTIKLYS